MSDDLSGLSLMELFRMEAENQLAALNSGLVEFESDPSPSRAEALMRAAHSLKGAARICSLDTAVRLAHEMENVLVAAIDGSLRLTVPHIDWLLEGVDWLGQISRQNETAVESFQESLQSSVAHWINRLAAIPAAAPAAANSRTSTPAPAPAPAAVTEPISPPVASPIPELPAAEPPAAPPASGITVPNASVRGEPAEVAVRISGNNLQRLMELAAETSLESRRMAPFSRSLRELQQQHQHLRRWLDEFPAHADSSSSRFGAGTQWLAEMRNRLDQTEATLARGKDEFDDLLQRTTTLAERLHHGIVASRMRPLAEGIQGFPRLVRDTARTLNKRARFIVLGERTLVDRELLEKLEAPLGHMLRNSVDHGLESPEERAARGKPVEGRIQLEARHSAGRLCISVGDDGRGIDIARLKSQIVNRGLCTAAVAGQLSHEELLTFLFLPGFSTAEKVTEISGRGVGLDVVQTMVQAVGGNLRVSTEAGRGTTFHLQLPITRSLVRALLVEIADETFALPLTRIQRAVKIPRDQLHQIEGRPFLRHDEIPIGLVSGADLLDLAPSIPPAPSAVISAVIIGDSGKTYAVEVSRLVGECELLVRPLDGRLGKSPDISAVALLEDQTPVLILDLDDLLRSISSQLEQGALRPRITAPASHDARAPKRILVVEDSLTVREMERKLLTQAGYEVHVAEDGMAGWHRLLSTPIDLVITDVDLPRLTGLQLIARIRQSPRLSRLPVIILSYKDRPEDRTRGLEAGANHYLTKSGFRDQTLVHLVAELLNPPAA